jgi:hypothetical protein
MYGAPRSEQYSRPERAASYANTASCIALLFSKHLSAFCKYILAALGIRTVWLNIMSAPSTEARIRRAFNCSFCFAMCFALLNRDLVFHRNTSVWVKTNWGAAPVEAIMWLVFSLGICQWITLNVSKAISYNDPLGEVHLEVTSDDSNEDMVAARQSVLASSKKVVPESSTHITAADICPVCFIELHAAESIRTTPCKHDFCSACLEAYVETCQSYAALNCPLCRGKLHPLAGTQQNSNAGSIAGRDPPGSDTESGRAVGSASDSASNATMTVLAVHAAPGPPVPSPASPSAFQVVPQPHLEV